MSVLNVNSGVSILLPRTVCVYIHWWIIAFLAMNGIGVDTCK